MSIHLYSHESWSVFDLVVLEQILDDGRNHASSLESYSPRWISHINMVVSMGRSCRRHVSSMKEAERRAKPVSGCRTPVQETLTSSSNAIKLTRNDGESAPSIPLSDSFAANLRGPCRYVLNQSHSFVGFWMPRNTAGIVLDP